MSGGQLILAATPLGNILDASPRLKETLEQEKDKFLRLFAEFENYKKRTSKERLELYKTASQELMTALLPIIDDMDRAFIEFENRKKKVIRFQ